MNSANVDWAAALMNWLPALLIFGAILLFSLWRIRGGSSSEKEYMSVAKRQAEALERIAAALERRS